MSAATSWPAPAKLNLFLHITARRSDGYHDLQTVFQLIDLVDDIRIEVRPDGLIERQAGPDGVTAEADLVVRAAPGRCRPSRRPGWAPISASQSAFPWAAAWGAAVPTRRQCWWHSITCGTAVLTSTILLTLASNWVPMCPYSCGGTPPGRKGVVNA